MADTLQSASKSFRGAVSGVMMKMLSAQQIAGSMNDKLLPPSMPKTYTTGLCPYFVARHLLQPIYYVYLPEPGEAAQSDLESDEVVELDFLLRAAAAADLRLSSRLAPKHMQAARRTARMSAYTCARGRSSVRLRPNPAASPGTPRCA
nr:uncharacterized protein CTRU02_14226 [Colletotrichum truncatum]KAF6782449.1 hypothetical protein CTRU02_14226 [Colletotrichum truncatum]